MKKQIKYEKNTWEESLERISEGESTKALFRCQLINDNREQYDLYIKDYLQTNFGILMGKKSNRLVVTPQVAAAHKYAMQRLIIDSRIQNINQAA